MIDEDGLIVVNVLDFDANQPGGTLQPSSCPFSSSAVPGDDGEGVGAARLVVEGALGGDDAGLRVQSEGRQVVHSVRSDKVIRHRRVLASVGVLGVKVVVVWRIGLRRGGKGWSDG